MVQRFERGIKSHFELSINFDSSFSWVRFVRFISSFPSKHSFQMHLVNQQNIYPSLFVTAGLRELHSWNTDGWVCNGGLRNIGCSDNATYRIHSQIHRAPHTLRRNMLPRHVNSIDNALLETDCWPECTAIHTSGIDGRWGGNMADTTKLWVWITGIVSYVVFSPWIPIYYTIIKKNCIPPNCQRHIDDYVDPLFTPPLKTSDKMELDFSLEFNPLENIFFYISRSSVVDR